MNLTKRRWLVLVASCLINLCIGALYAWSVFVSPMAAHISQVREANGFGAVTASDLSIVFSIANMLGPVTMIFGGKLVRTIGPRLVIMIGGVWFGIGMLICGFASSVPVLILGFGICCGLAVGMAYGCTVSNCVKFFPDRRGLVGGIATASYGLSSVIVPIIANAIMERTDVSAAFRILGIAIVVIVLAASIFVLPCPDGFAPEGYVVRAADKNSSGRDYTWKEMLSTGHFYVMIVLMCCGAFMGMMIISQASPIAQNQIAMDAAGAAVAVSALALFNTGGRIIGGFISDLIGQINTLLALLAFAVAGLFMLILAGEGSMATFYLGICIVGICFGGFMGIYPGFTNQKFGAKYSSVNYGIMFIGFAFSGFFAPITIGKIYGVTNGYIPAYFVAIALSLLGIALTFVYRKMNRKTVAMK